MKNILKFLVVATLLFSVSCTDKKEEIQNWKDYYTPYQRLSDSDLLLEYSYSGSEQAPFYWYYTLGNCDDGQECVIGQQLDVNSEVQVETKEMVLNEGVILKQQTIIEIDTLTEQRYATDVAILADDLFSFKEMSIDQQLSYAILFHSSVYDDQKTSISRKRQFLGDTTVTFEGKSYPALRFKLSEMIDIEEVGHLELNLEGEETYAKGLGLVHTIKGTSDGTMIEFYLSKYEYIEKTN